MRSLQPGGMLAMLLAVALVACSGASGDHTGSIRTEMASSGAYDAMGDIYVSPDGDDRAAGTARRPLATIQAAVDRAEAGERIIVRAGLYSERVMFEGVEDSGEPGAPIRLSGEAGAIIDGSAFKPSGLDGLIVLRDVRHVTIEGFELRNFSTTTGFNITDTPIGVLIIGSGGDLDVRGLRIHNIANMSTCTQKDEGCGPAANGIAVFGTSSAGIEGLRLHDNELYALTLSSSEALTLNGNVSRFEIIGNTVRDTNNIAFDIIGFEQVFCEACENDRARNGILRENRAENNSNRTNPWYAGGDGSAVGFYVDGGRNILIERNRATGNDIGVSIGSEAPGRVSQDVLIASNLIHGNHEAGIVIGGYAASAVGQGGGGAGAVHVVNNTLHDNAGWGAEIFLQHRVSDLRVINNIIVCAGDLDESVYMVEASDGSNWVNNLWWADDGVARPPVDDRRAVLSDPGFVSLVDADVRLREGAAAIDSGASVRDLAGWTDAFWLDQFEDGALPGAGSADLLGFPREQGVIDIGAVEH